MLFKHPIHTRYRVNETGEIFGPRKKISPILHHTGYLVVSVTPDGGGKQVQMRAHRLIWEAITGKEIPEDYQINHKDGNKQNNNISNLELCTAQENIKHRDTLGLSKPSSGEDHYASKANTETIFKLFKDLEAGLSNSEIGEKYGYHSRYVSLIRHERRRVKEWELYKGSETIETERE